MITKLTLLNICHNYNLNIANEQIPKDRLRNFTCFNNLCASVVDYLLADSNIWEKILEFKVLDPIFDSKHAPITATLKFSTSKLGKKKLFSPPKSNKWSDQGWAIFKSILNLPETKNRSQSYKKFLAETVVERKLKTSLKVLPRF